MYHPDPELDRRCKNYLRALARRRKARTPRSHYWALGGPYHDQLLTLDNAHWGATTARLRIGNQVGRYVEIPESEWSDYNLYRYPPKGKNYLRWVVDTHK